MTALLAIYQSQFIIFTLVLTRISGLVMTAPIFGDRAVPVRVRALLAVGLAVLVTPVCWNVPFDVPTNILDYLILVGGDLLVGITLGIGLKILFSGLQIAGQIAGQMSGMHLADVFDPAFNSSVPIFSKLLNLVALAVFVLIGGHRQLLTALLDTFQTVPPGQGGVATNMVETLTNALAQSFALGIRAAAPIMVSLLMSILVMGLISRTLPQLNVLVVGFNLNAMIMLAALSISLGSAAWLFQDQVVLFINAFRDLYHSTDTVVHFTASP